MLCEVHLPNGGKNYRATFKIACQQILWKRIVEYAVVFVSYSRVVFSVLIAFCRDNFDCWLCKLLLLSVVARERKSPAGLSLSKKPDMSFLVDSGGSMTDPFSNPFYDCFATYLAEQNKIETEVKLSCLLLPDDTFSTEDRWPI